MFEATLLLTLIASGIVLLPLLATVVVVVAMRSQAATFQAAMGHMREVANSALIARGLNPHVVDPNTYGPSGMKRTDEEATAAKVAAAQEQATSDEEEALRSAEDKYLAMLAAQAGDSSAVGNRH